MKVAQMMIEIAVLVIATVINPLFVCVILYQSMLVHIQKMLANG